MTNAEYYRLYNQSRNNIGIINLKLLKKIKSVYSQAALLAAKEVQSLDFSGKSDLTISQWKNIEKQLVNGGKLISEAIEKDTPEALSMAYRQYYNIDSMYILSAAKEAGQGAVDLIKPKALADFGFSIDKRLIADLLKRQNKSGYTFVESIWNLFDKDGLPIGVNGDYQYRIKNLIQTGLAQGRDAVKVSTDIMEYVEKGKDAVFKPGRYGRLEPGTAAYKARIPDTIDWRALRLVRSEMYMSLQNASLEQGKFNPGCNGQYNWVLTQGTLHSCICPDLAKASPYPEKKIPEYPHSNCMCTITPLLRDHDQFIADMVKFSRGNSVEYMDEWYETLLKNAA